MSAFGGKADIERRRGCYLSCGKRCFTVGDRCDCLFTTVRFAQQNLSSPFARAAAGPIAAAAVIVKVIKFLRRCSGVAAAATVPPTSIF